MQHSLKMQSAIPLHRASFVNHPIKTDDFEREETPKHPILEAQPVQIIPEGSRHKFKISAQQKEFLLSHKNGGSTLLNDSVDQMQKEFMN
jgi:hypothetical protein